MHLQGGLAHDMLDPSVPCQKSVGNQRTVAPPGHGFRTHDGNSILLGHLHEFPQTLGEFRRLHVVGKSSKGSIPPCLVGRIGQRMPQAAQFWHVLIGDFHRFQCGRQRLLVELWIVPRFRNGTHIDEASNPVDLQEMKKCLQVPG